jgi:hypothetical protein
MFVRSRVAIARAIAPIAQMASGTTISGMRARGTIEPNGSGSHASHPKKTVRHTHSTVMLGRVVAMDAAL